MKLKNKKTGEVGLVHCDATMFSNKIGVFIDNNHIDLRNPYKIYTSLAELNEEWEDYEENEYYYAITSIKADSGITKMKNKHNDMTSFDKTIGNYFSSREEAELALEKLKAWKRLKDKGFRFIDHIDRDSGQGMTRYEWDGYIDGEDLDLLFGGDE